MDPTALVSLIAVFGIMLLLAVVLIPRDQKPSKINITCNRPGCFAKLKVDPEIFREASKVPTHPAFVKAQWGTVPVRMASGEQFGVQTFCPLHFDHEAGQPT